MRVTLDRAQLAHALSTVTKAVEARTTFQFLATCFCPRTMDG